jgi:hypothetical protein
MSENRINAREFVVATAAALILGIVLSIGAVYGLNRYFDDHDAIEYSFRPRAP